MATSPIPRVGVGVIVLKPDGMVLIGQRYGTLQST